MGNCGSFPKSMEDGAVLPPEQPKEEEIFPPPHEDVGNVKTELEVEKTVVEAKESETTVEDKHAHEAEKKLDSTIEPLVEDASISTASASVSDDQGKDSAVAVPSATEKLDQEKPVAVVVAEVVKEESK